LIVYSFTGNLAFDYFFSLNLNIGFFIWGLISILKLLKD